MRICVTGGSGFIGWYLCHQLAKRGHELVVLDLHPLAGDHPKCEFIRGDVRDVNALRKAFKGCDVVYCLAAAHHDFGIDEKTFYDVNEHASQLACDVMDERGIRKCVFYSSVAVYGDAPPPLREETTPQPNSPYGGSKLKGEGVFEAWTKKGGGRRCLVIRPTVTFGPRNFANMYSLIRQIHRKRFVRVGPARNIKSLSSVHNLVDATLFLWDKTDRPAFDVVAFIDKPDLTSREISQAVFDGLGRKMPSWAIPMWFARLAALPFDVVIAITGRNIPISGARIKKLFDTQTKFEADRLIASGFKPRLSLREAIAEMVQWYVKEGHAQSPHWRQPPAQPVMMTAEE
jgi:nucleoside-diphosphate-sugar epimerase